MLTKYDQHRAMLPWIVAIALFIETLDTTIITSAIPSMATYFNVNPISLKFALTSYLISLSIFIPISGWLADRFGAKYVFVSAIGLFTLSSFLCGFSQTLNQLIICRLLQGISGAFMMPIGRLILLQTFSKTEIIKVSNYVTMPPIVGPFLGPTIGGIIVSYLSWQWIFFINIPFGVIGCTLVIMYLNNSNIDINKPFDIMGFILIGYGLAGVSLVLEVFNLHIISYVYKYLIMFTSLSCLMIYILIYPSNNSPIIDLKLIFNRTFRVGLLGSFFSRLGIGGIPFILPIFFKVILNYHL